MTSQTNKKKKPPTFHHLPAHKAKKIKQDWVLKAKLRSKWHAQKRREFGHNNTSQGDKEDDIHDDNVPESQNDHDDSDRPTSSSSPSPIVESQPTTSHSEDVRREERVPKTKQSHNRPSKSFSQRGHGREKTSYRGRSRGGQPNMRARMNDLLDKIQSMT